MGFMVGFSEALKYSLFMVATVEYLSQLVVYLGEFSEGYDPATWLVYYVLGLPLLIYGGRTFWNISMVASVITIITLLLYCFGALAEGTLQHTTSFARNGFLEHFSFCTSFFSGIDVLTLTCSDVKDVRRNNLNIIFVVNIHVFYSSRPLDLSLGHWYIA
jgi:hypothetical protein